MKFSEWQAVQKNRAERIAHGETAAANAAARSAPSRKTSIPASAGMTEKQKPQASSAEDREFYVGMLASEECLCGREKLRGNTFCRKDYLHLPEEMRKALYRRLGNGYEQACDEAVVWLQKNGW